MMSNINSWWKNNGWKFGVIAFILGIVGTFLTVIYLISRDADATNAAIEAPYIASKDIAIADVIRNKGGGIKYWGYHYNVFAGGTGCLGMTIQVDVANQSPGGKYTESTYCCDGKECRTFSSKEF